MSYTMADFGKEVAKAHLKDLTPEERCAGLSPEERCAGLSPEERCAGLSPEQIEQYLQKLKTEEANNPPKKRRRK